MANFIVRALARLAAPIVEEAMARIHDRRSDETECMGKQDIASLWHVVFGRETIGTTPLEAPPAPPEDRPLAFPGLRSAA